MRIGYAIRAAALLYALTEVMPAASPALTQIQDTIYKADGTRFRGVAVVEWRSFTSAEGSNIGMQATVVPITDGVLKVKLAPTTNASGGAYYVVRYNSGGKVQFTEYWAVPPSTGHLKIAAVRSTANNISASLDSGETIQISDVVGLQQELAVRPVKGSNYTPGRAAMINDMGQLEGVLGSTDDCVHVDGTSAPCGTGGGSSAGFVDQETPSGSVDGSNTSFALGSTPDPPESLNLFRNGIRLSPGPDFSLSGNNITFVSAATPQPGDILVASYRTASESLNYQIASRAATSQTYMGPQVICGGTGASTVSTASTALATCNIPAGLLQPGDRVEVQADWAHSGSSAGFVVGLRWGGTEVLSRGLTASETLLSSRVSLAVSGNGVQWSGVSQGASSANASSLGVAADSFASGITLVLSGAVTGSSGDSVALRGYTVLRYRSQSGE